MKILLVGGSCETRFLVKSLRIKNYNVTVINQDKAFCTALSDEYDIISVCGDGSNPYVLEKAQVDKMDFVVALDDKDATNFLVCEIAKNQFYVPKVMAVVADPQNKELFCELDVDCCICMTDFFEEMIEPQAAHNDIS